MGGVLASLLSNLQPNAIYGVKIKNKESEIAAAMLVAIICGGMFLTSQAEWMPYIWLARFATTGFAMISLLLLALLFSHIHLGRIGDFFSHLGDASYSLYLLHGPFLTLALQMKDRYFTNTLNPNYPTRLICYYSFVFVTTIIISLI